jgi:hypothetical protein
MAQRDYSRHQQKIIGRYYEHIDTIALNKLGELVSDLYLCEDDRKAAKLWQNVKTALARTPADTGQVARILETRDLQVLAKLVTDLSNQKPTGAPPPTRPPQQPTTPGSPGTSGASAPQPPSQPTSGPTPGASSGATSGGGGAGEITPETLKAAYNAFKKRLKLARLDESSKIGRSPLSTGSRPSVVAIQPPREYPRAVWDELVRQGRLKHAGSGLYAMP